MRCHPAGLCFDFFGEGRKIVRTEVLSKSYGGLAFDDPLVDRFRDPEAGAGSLLQPRLVKDADGAPVVADEAGLLQGVCHERYGRTLDP